MFSATIIGTVEGTPKLSYASPGQPVLWLTVRCRFDSRLVDGAWHDLNELVRVSIAGVRAEALAQRLVHGSTIFASGYLLIRRQRSESGHTGVVLTVSALHAEPLPPSDHTATQTVGEPDVPVRPV